MSTYKPIDECRTVEELLSDPARWTQGDDARNEKFDGTHPLDAIACQWCVRGAMRRIYRHIDERVVVIRNFCEMIGMDIVTWNDDPSRTHAEVLEAVRKAGI